MGKRKLTFQQQLVAFCMTANTEQIDIAYDTIKAAKDVRTPKVRKAKSSASTAVKLTGTTGGPTSVN